MKKRRRIMMSIVGIGLLVVGIFVSYRFLTKREINPMEKINSVPNEQSETGSRSGSVDESVLSDENEKSDGAVSVDSADRLSLASLFEKKFDGRDLRVGPVLERQSSYTRYFITYRSGELEISGIMNVPEGKGPFPVLILNHGYIDTAIYTNGRGLRREQDYLARQGFVIIHPDYRNHAESSRVDEGELENRLGYVEDVINLVYAVRASSLPYLDKENIGMFGHSMGGGIAQTVAVVSPHLVKAIALYAPVSMEYRDSYLKYMATDAARALRIEERYGAALSSGDTLFWDALSPKTHVDRIAVPLILFQGTSDTSVPKEWSDKTDALLKGYGKTIEYVVYEGEGHEFGPRFTDFMDQTVKFFRTHLK